MADFASSAGTDVPAAALARNVPLPTFTEFYRAVNGREPLPWQARLAEQVARCERWPTEIGVPTGLGKTACLDIAIWWLASQSDRAPHLRTAPTRIWWVVNRRLLVDSTAEHARAMAGVLQDPSSAVLNDASRDVIECIADRLRSLWVDPKAPPLDVISLRGGLSSRSPTDPARPTVVLCTVPMYGSRLLFRGYGSSRPSIDAAMAGADSLVLLDEAHLAGHLRALVPALAACYPKSQKLPHPDRSSPTVVALTATGDAEPTNRFELDHVDKAHPLVRQRLDAGKPLQVRTVTGDPARRLAQAAAELLQEASAPAACLVFSNSPKTARETFGQLRAMLPKAEGLLLTGFAREREAAAIRARILDPINGMPATRPPDQLRKRHLIVVATQTLEVGADIDADYLVTEACGVRALTQRLGRLNRFGRFSHARAVYVHLPPARSRPGRHSGATEDTWPVYGSEPATVLKRLLAASSGRDGGVVDVSPRTIVSALGVPLDDPGRAPEVLPGLLWEWTKTTTLPDGEAPVEPYFSGVTAPRLSVSLLWRAHVPEPGQRIWPRSTDREAIDVPLAEAREVLADDVMRRLAPDGATVEEVSAGELHPGDRIVVASDAGHMDRFGWNPGASECVPDASLPNLGLPLDAVAIQRLCGLNLGDFVDTALRIADDDRDIDEAEQSEAVANLLTALGAAPTPAGWDAAEWSGFLGRLCPRVLEPRNEVPRLPVEAPEGEPLSDEFDELSLSPVAVDLKEHGQAVGARARKVAEQVGLTDDLLEVVERAARLHDIGKADARFQRWLAPDHEAGPLLAKSDSPRHRWEANRFASGWPRGGRHEELSARLVRALLAHSPDWGSPLQRDLLVHLVISHHGKGRPLVPPASDGMEGSLCAVVEGVPVSVSSDLAEVDWEQPGRFQRLQAALGPWGLALLEAIVRRADHAVSAGVNGASGDE